MYAFAAFLILLSLPYAAGDAHGSHSEGYSWRGEFADKHGKATYAPSCGYECAEDYRIELVCNTERGSSHLTILADSDYEPNSFVRVAIKVDESFFNLEGKSDEGGLFGPVPTIRLGFGSPVIQALAQGSRFEVYFGSGAEPAFEGHLRGSAAAIEAAGCNR